MKRLTSLLGGILAVMVLPFFAAPVLLAQGTVADYERALRLRERFEGLAIDIPGRVTWIEETHRFWYRKSVRGGNQFVIVDADALAKGLAFDHISWPPRYLPRPAGSILR